MIPGRWWKSHLSFLQSWWLQFWCPGGREEVCNQTTNAEGLLRAECGGEGSKGSSWTQQVWHGKTKGEVRTSRRLGTLNATGRQKGRLIPGKELYRWRVRCEMGIAHARREGSCWWGKELQDGKQRFKVHERPSSRGQETKLWRKLHRVRQNKGCGRQAEKLGLVWAPGKNDWGCPVEKNWLCHNHVQGNQLLLYE